VTESFGARLRSQRERKGIALDTIARSTKINIALFDALERGDASRWPSGLFRRAFIRAYAAAIGLDPESTVREFLQHFPDPSGEAPPAAADKESIRATAGDAPADAATTLRLTLADDVPPLASGRERALPGVRRRVLAAACDLAIVAALAAAAFAAAGLFWMPFAVATAIYYAAGVLVFGSSPGAWLAARTAKQAPAADLRVSPAQRATPPGADSPDNLRRFGTHRYPRAV
jgi:hypothetical protein